MRTKAASSAISNSFRQDEVYFDYAASTPCDPVVVDAMIPYLVGDFANPSSSHRAGNRAHEAVELSRARIASAVGALPEEVIFSGGATESNNLAILGLLARRGASRRRVVTTAIEHSSVIGPCRWLASVGFDVKICPVEDDGGVDLGALSSLLDESTALLSIQAANNEIGTIQPVREATQLAHAVGALVHTDAAQAFGRITVDVERSGIDLMSLSAHKCYGPKGVGALVIRRELSSLLAPLIHGGGQEQGLRPGTHNSPGIVGFGCAASLVEERQAEEATRVSALRDSLEKELLARIEGSFSNGSPQNRLPGALSLTIPGVDADALIANTPSLMMSSSSACHSGAPEPSHVLLAIGLTREEAYSTVRLSLGRFTTARDVLRASDMIADAAARIRKN